MADHSKHEQSGGWEDIWRSGDIPPRYRSFAAPNESVATWAETLPAGGFILDVGCGIGRHLIYLGERGFRIAGADVSPSGIRLAQEACESRQIVLDGRVSDMTNLLWEDMIFDGALSTSAIHHNLRAGIAQTLGEIWRVLKPGGLFLVDFPCTDTLTYQQLRNQVAAGEIKEVEPDTFVDDRPDSDDPDAAIPHHFCTETDVRDLMRSFEIIRLWGDLRDVTLENGESGKVGRWVASARRPL